MFSSYIFFRFGYRVVKKFLHIGYFIESLWVGFWLGILKRNILTKFGELHYNNVERYFNDDHNKKPLFNWEKNAIEFFFKECRSIMVIGAGGGREVYNLEKMGFDVDGFECNEKMCEYANMFLSRMGMKSKVIFVEHDKVPVTTRKYDAVIVGWGAYTHIKGTHKRHLLLKDIYELLNINGKVLISFLKAKSYFLKLGLIFKWGNFWARIFRNEKIEKGDTLLPYHYGHYFYKAEIENELNSVGFEMLNYDETDYGNAVGKKK